MPAPEGYFQFDILGTVATTELTLGNIVLEAAFPNPASTITCIPVSSPQTTKATILLKDVFGRTVSQLFTGELPKGDSKYFFNAAELAAGTYFIELQTIVGSHSQAVVVK